MICNCICAAGNTEVYGTIFAAEAAMVIEIVTELI
jgi:hypothetical protein